MTSGSRSSALRRVVVAGALAALGGPLLLAGTASAHVTPQDPEAPSGGYFTTAFKVGHGCDESPTTKVSIKMGEGVTSVAPQAVPGWTVSTTKRQLDPPIDNHGTKITESVDEVIWEGGPLPVDQLQMFWISMKMPEGDPGTAVEFPVVQTCEVGETAWIEPTVEGEEEPEHPAPAIVLTASAGEHGDATEDAAADDGAEVAAESASSTSDSNDDDSGSSNGLAIGALLLGALGLVTGGTALARSSKKS